MRHRVLASPLGHWVDPARAYTAICGDSAEAFWLDSGVHAAGGMSYLGVADSLVSDVHGTEFDGPVLEWMAAELDHDVDTAAAPPGFTLGLIGWLGYELRAETMGTPETRHSRYPRAAWLRVHRALAFDHAAREVWLLALVKDERETTSPTTTGRAKRRPGGHPRWEGCARPPRVRRAQRRHSRCRRRPPPGRTTTTSTSR